MLFLFDTGAKQSFVSRRQVKELGLEDKMHKMENVRLKTANGGRAPVIGWVDIRLMIGEGSTIISFWVLQNCPRAILSHMAMPYELTRDEEGRRSIILAGVQMQPDSEGRWQATTGQESRSLPAAVQTEGGVSSDSDGVNPVDYDESPKDHDLSQASTSEATHKRETMSKQEKNQNMIERQREKQPRTNAEEQEDRGAINIQTGKQSPKMSDRSHAAKRLTRQELASMARPRGHMHGKEAEDDSMLGPDILWNGRTRDMEEYMSTGKPRRRIKDGGGTRPPGGRIHMPDRTERTTEDDPRTMAERREGDTLDRRGQNPIDVEEHERDMQVKDEMRGPEAKDDQRTCRMGDDTDNDEDEQRKAQRTQDKQAGGTGGWATEDIMWNPPFDSLDQRTRGDIQALLKEDLDKTRRTRRGGTALHAVSAANPAHIDHIRNHALVNDTLHYEVVWKTLSKGHRTTSELKQATTSTAINRATRCTQEYWRQKIR